MKVLFIVLAVVALIGAVALFKHKTMRRTKRGVFTQPWRPAVVVLVIAAIVLAILAFKYPAAKASVMTSSASTSSTSSTSVSVASPSTTVVQVVLSKADIAALTMHTITADCLLVVYGVPHSTRVLASGQTLLEFPGHIGELLGTPPRYTSDSLSTPYVSTTPAAMLHETQQTICLDPEYGSAIGYFFAHMMVGNVSLLSLYPWLKPFDVNASTINSVAAAYVQLIDAKSADLTEQKAVVNANLAWQQEAAELDTLLTRFQLGSVAALPSVSNLDLAVGGAVVGGLPPIQNNPNQESLPALMFELTQKGQQCPLEQFGLNIKDKRPEQFAPSCAPLAAASTPAKVVPATVAAPKPSSHATPAPVPATTAPAPAPSSTSTTAPAPTTTVPETTTTVACPPGQEGPHGKCIPPTTVPAPPVTVPASTTSTTTQGSGSGWGATSTVPTPTTVAPAPTPPTSSAPVTAPPTTFGL